VNSRGLVLEIKIHQLVTLTYKSKRNRQ